MTRSNEAIDTVDKTLAGERYIEQPVVYKIIPLSEQCASIVNRGGHALVGLSPFNNYYSYARICSIFEWVSGVFRNFDALVPGEEAALTLIAGGEPAHTAATKARFQVSKLRSRAVDAMSRLGIQNAQARAFSLAQFAENTVYKKLRQEVRDCYLSDANFRALCLDTAKTVVTNRLSDGAQPTPVQVEIAVEYLMAELPLLLDSPGILGIDASVFCYHKTAPLFSAIFMRGLPVKPSTTQAGAAIVEDLQATAMLGRGQ